MSGESAFGTKTEIGRGEEMLENYDPDASDVVLTRCPGCREVIVIFQSGDVAEPRIEPLEPGVLPGLLDSAFQNHYCSARDGLFECKGCRERYDDEQEAERCCSGPYEQHGYAEVDGADPIAGETDG